MKWQLSLGKIAVSNPKRNQTKLSTQHKIKNLKAKLKMKLRAAALNSFKRF
jgi:hypothetical protein